jgi:hypothetical protein
VDTNRKRKRADVRRRRVFKRIFPLVRAVGRELARDALQMLAEGSQPGDVAHQLARRVSRPRP